MPSNMISISGKVTKVSEQDAQRLGAFVLLCNQIIASGPVLADGTYRISVSRAAALAKSSYAPTLAIAPASAGKHIEHFPSLPRVVLKRADIDKADKEFRAPDISVSEAVLKIWGLWCRWFCVSGTVSGPNGCAAPGAEVTVYTVSHNGSGYTKIPRATVTTAADGSFTACFEWCSCSFCFPCWPCWPIWWRCWPWWWEWDILRVLEAIEKQPALPGPGPVSQVNGGISLIRPDARSLMRGQGFGVTNDTFAPNAERTQLIASKFANARIRELFPWWWWCCDDPNLVFSVTQNGNVILNENPATSTRWCFEDGGSVALVGNSDTDTLCGGKCPPESGFAWTNVGDYIEVADINQGYADPSGSAGTDDWDMAFAGELFLYGEFAVSSTVAYYQVLAGQWSGNPARGGTQPAIGTGPAISEPLDHVVYIYNGDGTFNSSQTVRMGPFNQGSLVNLYATPAARQNGPTPPGLLPFPTVPAGGSVFWDHQGLVAHTYDSSDLIGGSPIGAVDLSVVGYDSTFTEVLAPNIPPPGPPDEPLTLLIDNSGLSAQINGIAAFTAGGTPVTSTTSGECPAYDIGPGGYIQVSVNVNDPNGHLFEYGLFVNYGSGSPGIISPPGTRGYITNPLTSPAPAGVCFHGDPDYTCKSWVGGTEIITYCPPVDCCYDFILRVGKRVTNGDSFPSLGDDGTQTMTLKVSS